MHTIHEKFDVIAVTLSLCLSGGVFTPAELEGAVLPSQKVIHFLFPFRFEEDIEEDRNHCQEAGHGHRSYHQPCKCGVCEQRDRGR